MFDKHLLLLIIKACQQEPVPDQNAASQGKKCGLAAALYAGAVRSAGRYFRR